MLADVLRKNSTGVAFIHQRVELTAANFYDRKFRGDEESVENNKPEDDRQLAQDNQGRVPVLGDRFGQRNGREENRKKRIHGTDARPHTRKPASRPSTSSTSSHPG